MTNTDNYWAAVNGDEVYGVGATKYEAESDADYSQEYVHNSERVSWELLPCSQAAYDEYVDRGFSHERIAVLDNRVITRAELDLLQELETI